MRKSTVTPTLLLCIALSMFAFASCQKKSGEETTASRATAAPATTGANV